MVDTRLSTYCGKGDGRGFICRPTLPHFRNLPIGPGWVIASSQIQLAAIASAQLARSLHVFWSFVRDLF